LFTTPVVYMDRLQVRLGHKPRPAAISPASPSPSSAD